MPGSDLVSVDEAALDEQVLIAQEPAWIPVEACENDGRAEQRPYGPCCFSS
jgi:hypothetical protein